MNPYHTVVQLVSYSRRPHISLINKSSPPQATSQLANVAVNSVNRVKVPQAGAKVRSWSSWPTFEREEGLFAARSLCHWVFLVFPQRCMGTVASLL